MTTKAAPTAAGIYVRISQDRDDDGGGVERQLADCMELCKARGYEVADVYRDNSVSAYKRNGRRPEYQRMVRDIDGGRIGTVVVYNLDRLYRQPRELEQMIDRCEDGRVTVAAVTGSTIDLDNPTMARIMIAFANQESRDKSRRIARKHADIAKRGNNHGGQRAYGYDGDSVVPHEAAVIRECVELLISGRTLRSVARMLNARGDLTPTGKPWVPNVMRQMLIRKRHVEFEGSGFGTRVHHLGKPDETHTRAAWPAILSHEQHVAILARCGGGDLARWNPDAPRVPFRRHLLSGFAYCAVCGTALQARTRKDQGNRVVYRCPGSETGASECVSVDAVKLDAHTVREAFRVYGSFKRDVDVIEPDATLYDTSALRAELDVIEAAFDRGDLNADQYARATGSISRRIAKVDADALAATVAVVTAQTQRSYAARLDTFDELELDDKRAHLARVLYRVVVSKGRGDVAERSRVVLLADRPEDYVTDVA